jgi:site-specific recombinase XerD
MTQNLNKINSFFISEEVYMAVSTKTRVSLIDFIESLEVERNVSPLTIRNYTHYLNRFADWFEENGYKDLKELDREVLRKYRVYLARYEDDRGRTLSKKTQSYYIISLRSWLKFLTKNDAGVLHPEKVDLPKGESTPMKFLSAEKIETLFAQPDVSNKSGLRDRAILEVLFSTGLRVSELVSLNRDQIDLDKREFGVIGKGRSPSVVFLGERSALWLKQWLSCRDDNWRPIFVRFSGQKPDLLTDGEEMRLTVQEVFKEW